jgi:general secretion pathway protein L
MKRLRGEVLALLTGEDPDGPISFARLAPGRAETAIGILAVDQRGGAPAARPQRTILILPASLGRLTHAVLPARTEAQARAAAPFLLEETIATEGADLHYAVGAAQNEDGQRLLAVIEKALLSKFLARCRGHGADPHIVLFDCAALRPEPGEAKALETDDRLVIGADGQGGVSLEPALGRALAPRWLQSLSERLGSVAYVGADPIGFRVALQGQAQLRALPLEPAVEVLARDALMATAVIPNLRQGEFAPGTARREGGGRGWRIAAFFAAAAILAQGAAQGVAGHRASQEALRVEAAAQSAFRDLLPNFPEGGNIPATVRALQNSAARAEAHPVLQISPALTEVLAGLPDARLDSLTHASGDVGIQIVVSSLNPAAIQAVADGLQGRGFSVTQGPGGQSLTRASQDMIVEPAP